MKAKIAIITFILSYGTSNGQFITDYGLKAGLTLSTCKYSFHQPFSFETKYTTGFSAAVFADAISSKHIGLYSEGGFEQRGFQWRMLLTNEFGNASGYEDWDEHTYYFYAAAGMKLRNQFGNITPYLLILPRIDIYLGYDVVEGQSYSQISRNEVRDEILENFKRVNFGITFTAGGEIENLLPIKVLGEVSFSPAFMKSYEGNFVSSVKENYFSFRLGVNLWKDSKK